MTITLTETENRGVNNTNDVDKVDTLAAVSDTADQALHTLLALGGGAHQPLDA